MTINDSIVVTESRVRNRFIKCGNDLSKAYDINRTTERSQKISYLEREVEVLTLGLYMICRSELTNYLSRVCVELVSFVVDDSRIVRTPNENGVNIRFFNRT